MHTGDCGLSQRFPGATVWPPKSFIVFSFISRFSSDAQTLWGVGRDVFAVEGFTVIAAFTASSTATTFLNEGFNFCGLMRTVWP